MQRVAVKLYGMRISSMAKDELGPLLRKLREDADMSEAQMAVYQDVTVKTIQNWERGFSKPRLGDVLIYENKCGKLVVDVRDEQKRDSSCDTAAHAFWPTRERRRPRRTSRRRPVILMDSSIQTGPLDLFGKAA